MAQQGITTSCPLSLMLFQTSSPVDARYLAPTALSITHTLSSITLGWLKNRMSLFSQTPNSYQLSMDVHIPDGPDLFVTSWIHLGADCAWNIPGTTSQIPNAIRKPQSGAEGSIHIMPRSTASDESRPFELLLCLEEVEMCKVVNGLQKEGWVERVIGA